MLLLKDKRAEDQRTTTLIDLETDDDQGRIRCPRCGWRPSPSSRWVCLNFGPPEPPFDGCGTVWNTFDTGGRCPGCRHQWQWTSCLSCAEWSPHQDWYDSER